MRGIVLAGGTGSRLGALTKDTNKHCLQVYDRPMICWPLKTLIENGIDEITIVSTPTGIGQLAAILGDGRDCRLTYCVQSQANGIPKAIYAARTRSYESVAVILGDNVFLQTPKIESVYGHARCYLAKAENLQQFGVPVIEAGAIRSVVEKPYIPPSPYALTGLYLFNANVFSLIETLKPSARGEYEIADLLNIYAKRSALHHSFIDGFWGDAGTPEGLAECTRRLQCGS
jgi:glucose-1-phosphate thymidylyltransferase